MHGPLYLGHSAGSDGGDSAGEYGTGNGNQPVEVDHAVSRHPISWPEAHLLSVAADGRRDFSNGDLSPSPSAGIPAED
jgi:hypothetical protein